MKEKERLEKTKTIMVCDSNLRWVNEKAFYTRTDCATGAKIGHVANTLKHTKKENAEVVICHVGQNNIDETEDHKEWERMLTSQIGKLRNEILKFKKSIIVGIPPAPVCQRTEKAKEMRTSANNQLRSIARDNAQVSFIQIDQQDEEEVDWDDFRHMSPKLVKYMLGKVSEKYMAITGKQFFINDTEWTAKRKYGSVNATYRPGCERCTEMGHAKETCGVKNPKKRQKVSGSQEPEAKKGTTS